MRARRLPDAPPQLPTGAELLPGYRAVKLLAHGRRLDTWDAYDEERDARCVVKVVRADRASEPSVREALQREAEVVTTLAHPHLVRGYALLAGPRPALVLETLRGAALDALVEEAPLAPADAAALGLQLCSVLGWLHRHDWLHLDVKPANVVVDHGRAVLVDLSLAARPGPGRRGAGTRGYLAPEQARGSALTPATDVFGLGVTLLESLSGDLPFGDEATWDSRRRWPGISRRMPARPLGTPVDLPRDLTSALHACVELDPAARPALAELRAVLSKHAPAGHGRPW